MDIKLVSKETSMDEDTKLLQTLYHFEGKTTLTSVDIVITVDPLNGEITSAEQYAYGETISMSEDKALSLISEYGEDNE